MGLRVCKLWHSSLLKCVSEVTLVQRDSCLSSTSARELVRSLRQFTDVAVRLDVEACSYESLLELVAALNSLRTVRVGQFSQLSIRTRHFLDESRKIMYDSDFYDSDDSSDGYTGSEMNAARSLARKLASSIGLCHGLKELALSGCDLPMAGSRIVRPAACFYRSLTKISLHKGWALLLTSSSFWDLQHCKQLVHLDLRFNDLGQEQFEDLMENLRACPALQGLDIGCQDADAIERNGSTDIHGLEPLLGLAARTQLKHLGLGGCFILWSDAEVSENREDENDEHSYCCLAALLADCSALTYLDLSCICGGECAQQLARALENCNNLRNLALGWNNLGDDTDLLFRSLSHCGPLTHLELDSTMIGDKSAARLCGLLEACTSLEDLSLENNPITEKGVKILSRAVRTWRRHQNPLALRKLNLREINGGGSSAGAELQSLLTEMGCRVIL